VEWPERLTLSLPEAWKLNLKHRTNGGRLAHLFPSIESKRNFLTSS